MKKNTLLLITLFFMSFYVNAQKTSNKQNRGEKIKALKIAFITEELNLTSNEAEKFWPVYNKYDEILHRLERVERFKIKTKIKKLGGVSSLSEKEAKSLINKLSSLEIEAHKTKVKYNTELEKVLSFKKILKLKNAERDFVRKLMRRYKKDKKRK